MPKVLLIGWDAADWKVINPLMDAGHMPSLQKLVEQGVKGRMATLDPPLSPMLWTSIATGKRPYKHGIHGFTEPTPDGKDIRPIYSTGRSCKAVWNILNQENKKCHVVGWWPSHPAEPINGIMISNFYQRAEMDQTKPWVLTPGVVHPASKADFYAKLRVHPYEMTAAHLQPFVPLLNKVDQSVDTSLMSIAKFLADSSSIHSAATHIIEHEEWDFMAVYFDAIDHFSHLFMRYNPPQMPHVPLRQYEFYKDVIAGAYKFHDMLLGRYLELIDDDTYVMLISDHGFHPGDKRLAVLPDEPTGPAFEHSPYGIFVLKGPEVKQDELVFGASLLDVTPTLLHLFDLPMGTDMDGKVLTQAFQSARPVRVVPSWEAVEGNAGRHTAGDEPNEAQLRTELQQLVALGYIQDPGHDKEKAIRNTINENNFNLARAYINGQQWDQGIALLEELMQHDPKALRFATCLASAYQVVGKFLKARETVNHIRTVVDRESPQLDLLEGTLLLAENRPVKALELFRKVETESGDQPQLKLRVANAYFQLHKYNEAIEVLEVALKLDPEEAGAWYLLGSCQLNLTQFESAVDSLLHSIGLQYYHPASHYFLGEALLGLGKYAEAAKAFEVCLTIAPFMNVARKRLVSIYQDNLGMPEKAQALMQQIDTAIKGEMILVSGLPRSGTSMMMQMLQAGGIPLFTDNERQPDENNPNGFFEHEAVKNLIKSKAWLPNAVGKGVKVIAQLLPHLPLNYKYKVIFMERDLVEVIGSQQKMLARLNAAVPSDVFPSQLIDTFKTSVETAKAWAKENSNVEILFVNYDTVVADPLGQSVRIAQFLNATCSPQAMAEHVNPNLRREKLNT